jgi:T5SS/PEP-CTERM-associated repeat protein
MRPLQSICRSFGVSPLALVAALTMSAALPARAQFFSSTGANSTAPVNLLPIDPAVATFDFTGNTLYVGNSASGSFSAMAGALLKGNALSIASGATGSGSVTVTGPGTRAQLGGRTNRVEVGNWGVGSLVVSAGALVDATVNAGACTAPGAWCYSFIGNAAGSTGTLTVTGAGSELRALRSFGVGQVAVFTQAVDGFTFGTPGGTTNAFVNVLDGGTLRTEAARIGVGPSNAAATGTERAIANVVIDGPGSRWIASHNSIDNTEALFVAGIGTGGRATMDIRNGGKLIIDGSGGNGPFDVINLGVNGGRADMTVSGVGSSVEVKGNNPVLQAGRSGVGGQGSFSVLAGATASSLFVNVGRDGASGNLLIDGAGSQLSQVGVGTPGIAGAAFANIGRDAGVGHATLSNGGHWLISDGGGDSRPGNGSPGLTVGRGVGGNGTLTITGVGSTLEIVSTSLGLAPGVPDNFNPFVGIGYDSASSGELLVSSGGRLLMTGNALSTPADGRGTHLSIGGRSATLPSTGTATVTGAGSEIVVRGIDAFIGVGRGPGGIGTLNVRNQGRVASTSLLVGETGGTGTVSIDNATVALSGYRTDSANLGAGTTVGRGVGGNGTMTLDNGARLTIENNTFAGGMSIGGDQFVSGGSGVVSLNGASSMVFSGSVLAGSLTVGRSGTGVMTIAGGSTVDVGASRSVYVGREASGIGSLTLSGNSVLSAGYVGVGRTQRGDGGAGRLIVDNSTVTADTIEIGTLGYLGGNGGTINGSVILHGVLSPGDSPGRIIISGSFRTGSGLLILDVASNGSNGLAGFDIDHLILTRGSAFSFTGLQVAFNFLGGTDPNAFAAAGGFNLDNFLQSLDTGTGAITGLSSVFAPGVTWSSMFASSQFSARSDAYVITDFRFSPDGGATFSAAAVPEPATWALMFVGLVAISVLARRRSSETAARTSSRKPVWCPRESRSQWADVQKAAADSDLGDSKLRRA